jgi:hypothetical protein
MVTAVDKGMAEQNQCHIRSTLTSGIHGPKMVSSFPIETSFAMQS